MGAQGGASGDGVASRAGEGAGRPQQVVGDGGEDGPGGVGREPAGGLVGPGSVDEVRPDGLADGVPAVGDVGLRDGFGVVGEERVVAPDREQGVLGAGVQDPADDEPAGCLVAGAGERGEFHFGHFAVGDQLAGVGIEDRAGVVHGRVRLVGNGRDRGVHRGVAGDGQGEPGSGLDHRGDNYAESPRTRMFSACAPASVAVLMPSVSMLAAPLAEPARPARNRTRPPPAPRSRCRW